MRHACVMAGAVLGAALGCASTNEALLRNAVAGAGLPREVEGFRISLGRLKGSMAMFRYVRATPPAEFWVLRFERDPAEQQPAAFTELDSLLATMGQGKQEFAVAEKTRFLADRVRPVKAAYYTFQEDGARLEGCFCVWEEPGGGRVFALNCIADEKPAPALIERLLEECGAG
ncbi:MAG TPA: hypothetical protein DCM87_03165 [Planctomycetes bacterium]|nr:hypothetical protein [Planctomycetota bacterium]